MKTFTEHSDSPGSVLTGIVCGTDFTEESDLAADVAGVLANKLHLPLHLVHVIETPSFGGHPDVIRLLEESRREPLLKEARKLEKWDIDDIHIHSPQGKPDEVLIDLTRPKAAELLVLGPGEEHRLGSWLIGSVSERAVGGSQVPVMIVRDARPFRDWAKDREPLSVLIAFDFSVSAVAALEWVKQLGKAGPCEVTVAFIDSPDEQARRLGGRPLEDQRANSADVQAFLEHELSQRVAKTLSAATCRVEASGNDPEGKILRISKEVRADLIVAGSSRERGIGRFWHRSVARALIHGARTNVVIVPRSRRDSMKPEVGSPVTRVTVGIDFSDGTTDLIERAYSLVGGGGAIQLVHVLRSEGDDKSVHRIQSTNRKVEALQEIRNRLGELVPVEAARKVGIFLQRRSVRYGRLF